MAIQGPGGSESKRVTFGAWKMRIDGFGGRSGEARLSRAIPEAGPRRSCLAFNLNPHLILPKPYSTSPGNHPQT